MSYLGKRKKDREERAIRERRGDLSGGSKIFRGKGYLEKKTKKKRREEKEGEKQA